MPRKLTAAGFAAVLAQQTGTVFPVLLKIVHAPENGDPTEVRLVNNTEAVTFLGETYDPYPFLPVLPDQTEDTLPQIRLRVSNTDRRLIPVLRAAESNVAFTVWVGSLHTPFASPPVAAMELGPLNFTAKGFSYTADAIEVTLGYQDLLNQAFPAHRFDPRTFPGLFPSDAEVQHPQIVTLTTEQAPTEVVTLCSGAGTGAQRSSKVLLNFPLPDIGRRPTVYFVNLRGHAAPGGAESLVYHLKTSRIIAWTEDDDAADLNGLTLADRSSRTLVTEGDLWINVASIVKPLYDASAAGFTLALTAWGIGDATEKVEGGMELGDRALGSDWVFTDLRLEIVSKPVGAAA